MLQKLRGWRTIAVFAPIFVLSLLDGLTAIDLKPVFDALGVPEPNRALILCAMSLLALALRSLTTTPLGMECHPAEEKR